MLRRVILDPERGQNNADNPERHVKKKDPVPGGVSGNKSADGRADHWSGEPRPGDISNCSHQIALLRAAKNDETADSYHHRAADSLDDASHGELPYSVA